MARRKTSTAIVRVPAPRTSAPIIRVSAPRAPKAKRRSRRGGSPAKQSENRIVKAAIGGAAFGFIEKSFPNLPTIPMLGRAGTIAAAAYFLRGKLPAIAQDVGVAAAAIAGYQLGKEGKISGDDYVDGDIAPQVNGIAAQV